MKDELHYHLKEKYPKIFAHPCELSVGDGWFDLIDVLCNNIQGHIDNENRHREWRIKHGDDPDSIEIPGQVEAFQIKEKFGTLRFYVNQSNDYVYGLISMAEDMSGRICEDCGKPGETGNHYDNNFIRTMCDTCIEGYRMKNGK